ncbi:MAG TPA: ATPase domain-containing protein, partial [Polyangiaceae bacterium]|nr:ATPase domain-containing protein [Polyangiaceae bacterium]
MTSPSEPERAQTGIAGLDEILGGGLPRDRIYLVQGEPGAGKTTLAMQFLAAGARAGERCLLVTLGETRDELEATARSHGWALDGFDIFEMSALEQAATVERENALFESSEFELQETTRLILERVAELAPQRVVIDSLSELRLLAQSSLRYRRQLLGFKQHLSGVRCTALFLDDQVADAREHQLLTLAHGVLRLEHFAPAYGEDRRRLRVVKLRGVKYCGGHHDFAIQTGGLAVFPRLRASTHRRAFETPPLSSGVLGLDRLLGGGIDRGTSTLLTGPAGAGKSIIATQFALAAAERGESAAIFAFDEGAATFFERSRRLGLDIDRHVTSGSIRVQQIDPAEMSPGEFGRTAFAAVQHGARLIVIDSLNGYLTAMTDEKFLVAQLHELLSVFSEHGVSSLLIMGQFGMLGHMQTPVDVSYLSDTVLMLRYFEAAGRIRKAISVVKHRSGSHEDTIR